MSSPGSLEFYEMNVLIAWPLYHSVPSSLEMTPKWRLSALWMFHGLNSERN